jgi:hypothetical protein
LGYRKLRRKGDKRKGKQTRADYREWFLILYLPPVSLAGEVKQLIVLVQCELVVFITCKLQSPADHVCA